MEVIVNSKGQRVAIYRPYIDQEELKRNVVLYDPNGYNLSSGLYEDPRKCCDSWVSHMRQSKMRPAGIFDKYGQQYKY